MSLIDRTVADSSGRVDVDSAPPPAVIDLTAIDATAMDAAATAATLTAGTVADPAAVGRGPGRTTSERPGRVADHPPQATPVSRPWTPAAARPVARRQRIAVLARVRQLLTILTPLGRSVAVIGVLCWIVGWQLGWDEFLLAAATCLLLLLIGVLFAFGRLNVEIDAVAQPARLVVGQTASGQLNAVNSSRRRLLGLQVELLLGERLGRFDIPTLAPGQTHRQLFAIPTHRRAVIAVGPARTVRADPLGLWRRTMSWPRVAHLYVHPRTSLLEGFGAGLLRDMEGRTTDDTSTSDVELHTLRDYVPGDDRRYVHWRTSARSGRLMVRQFVDTRRSQVGIVLSGDDADYASEHEFELAVSVVASLGIRAVRDQQPVAITAAGRHVASASVANVLDGASGIAIAGQGTGLRDGAGLLLRRTSDVTLALLVTGSVPALPALRAAAARFGPDAVVVVFRATAAGPSGVRRVGRTSVMTLGALEDLPRLVRAVS